MLILGVGKEGENKPDLSDEGREAARELFMTYFDTDWRGREGKKRQREVMREVIQSRQVFPDIYEEVLEHFGLDVDEWRRFRRFIDERRGTK